MSTVLNYPDKDQSATAGVSGDYTTESTPLSLQRTQKKDNYLPISLMNFLNTE